MTLRLRWLAALAFTVSVVIVVTSTWAVAVYGYDEAASATQRGLVEPGCVAVERPVRELATHDDALAWGYDDAPDPARTDARLGDRVLAPRVLDVGGGTFPGRTGLNVTPPSAVSVNIDLAARPTVVASADALPFRPGVFDHVQFNNFPATRNGVPMPWSAIASESARVLGPGGTFADVRKASQHRRAHQGDGTCRVR